MPMTSDEIYKREKERLDKYDRESAERRRASDTARVLKSRLNEHIFHSQQVADLLELRGRLQDHSSNFATNVLNRGTVHLSGPILITAIDEQLKVELKWIKDNPV